MKFFKWRFKKPKMISVANENVELMSRIIVILDQETDNLYEAFNFVSEKYSTPNLSFILNSVLFFRTNFKDIVLVTKQMNSEKDEQQKNLTARTLALHLYEFLDDTKDFMGQKMRKELEHFPDSNFHIEELNKLNKYYQTIKQPIFQELRDIRHSTIGHKDQNSLELHRKIKEINIANIERSCMMVWVIIDLILKFQKNLLISIKKNINKKDELQSLPDVTLKKDDIENGLISIDFEIQDILLLVKGISLAEVKFFNELPPVIKYKMKELGNVEKKGLSEAIENLSRDEILSFYKVIKKYKKVKGV